MSYSLGLDEMRESVLRGELEARRVARQNGLCDYCHRPQRCKPACKFPDRHEGRTT